MNLRHSALTAWGLKRVAFEPDFTILDVGCGGGHAIQHGDALRAAGFADVEVFEERRRGWMCAVGKKTW